MSHALGRYRQDADGRLAPTPNDRRREEEGLDLDRLVWDPEYRAAMGPLLRRAG